MIFEAFEFLLYTLYLAIVYLIPIAMAAIAYASNDKQKMSRWLIHFLLINILKHTVFPILALISLQALNETLGICILILPIYISFETLEQFVENNYNNILAPKIEILRQKSYQGLLKFNLL
ncbi:unnamed protein product [Paramecium octaurelia]|uniref:Uncharacterized protein n=1 Tax=Paramecium octaurelia TaxID=43137 RepID=A0A8S1VUM1_PAROT|nr:unnamed protein product [Paramecium octaurelia]